MSGISIKRIFRDVMNIKKDPLEDQGIYIHWNEEEIYKVKALIIGPENTPYEYGNYLFDITFPTEYPHKPPTVTFQTRHTNIRFNPNLYCCGKVCVSILNTWSGPQWTSCQSLRSVLLSLQTLLNENPIQNEPGFENENGERSRLYNEILEYQNFNIAILKMINYPETFDIFIPQMRESFINNYDKIMSRLKKHTNKNVNVFSPIYNISVNANYKKLIPEIKELYLSFTVDLNVSSSLVVEPEKKINKCPTQKSKNYDVGYILLSSNDNNKYVVYQDKNNVKKWKKYKENIIL